MKLLRAETAGFCMGVDLALKKLAALIVPPKGPQRTGQATALLTFGPIIHNPQVLAEYAAKGVGVVNDPADIPAGATVVIRAHGIPEPVRREIASRGARIVDATCPKVKKAQTLISAQATQSKVLLLFGEADHPEVKGLLSYATAGAHVFDSMEELERMDLGEGPTYFLAAQTTQDEMEFMRIRDFLKKRFGPGLTVLSTICNATMNRQQEAMDLAAAVDFMVVVGGRESGNTRRLAQVARTAGTPCVHVETADELSPDMVAGKRIIGLTAGASTPKKIIDSVQQALEAF
ncbi:hydroxymethylbutenyl pyrophosphate reductase [Solidesulfovibrio fructosivorans JJ]]|uniref:4-hydroxy-3-methylbut-2-enyl diphosphate reductase n=1 Tax=Solidesulfovibrio fructosivorans JJ] TaxID=596151 RepID=E1JW10_SOLFR|nr:4-hydroxy-3-methylbut-2-enyl diphosphate reductase [Solidesulfovibrio fructosivorans]EFL51370.1 hydroxymethylbutenyl pyrophosphate reductase [Solidesulfovibrio fructosivorans JJ]]